MRPWQTAALLLVVTWCAACSERTTLSAAEVELIRKHARAFEDDLKLFSWCGTVRIQHAKQINAFGEAGWEVAIASSRRPEVLEGYRAATRKRKGR